MIERAGALATDPPDIVLVIGRPVRVRGAVLLQTAEQVTARGTSEDDLHEAIVGGGLLEPQVVAGLRGQLFIVMGAPGETGGRFDTERRDTADLRGWAADVFRAGAATVIMLPSMDPGRAEAVLRDDCLAHQEGHYHRRGLRSGPRGPDRHRDTGSARDG